MTNAIAKPQTPHEYLAAGEAAFAAGDRAGGSRLLQQAVETTFHHLARKHGLDDGDLHRVAATLDAKSRRPYPNDFHYRGSLGFASSMKHNAKLDYMGPNHVKMVLAGIREFVEENA